MKEIKNILYIVLFSSLLISCNDEEFLNLIPKHSSTVENYYIDTPGFEAALNAVYSRARDVYTSGHINYTLWHTGTDYAMNGENPTLHMKSQGTYLDFNTQMGSYLFIWTWGYDVISMSSYIIDNAVNENVKWNNPSDKNRIIAEAKFLRAWAYKYLVWSFGDIPLVKEAFTAPKTDFGRDPVEDIWDFIKSELEFAVQYLPDIPSYPGKLTRAAARHFLAETCLTLGEYAQAEKYAQSVIDNPQYSLMTDRFGNFASLEGDVFHDLFDYHNQNHPQNKEGIWVSQLELNVTGGNETIDLSGRVWSGQYFMVQGLVLSPEYGPATSRLRPTDYMQNLYEKNDIRWSEYNWQKTYTYNDPDNLPEGTQIGDTVALTSENEQYIYPHPKKWHFMPYHPTNPQYGQNRHDRYEIRLAETYLLLVEAQYLQGKTDIATENINIIRSRAKASPIAAAQLTIDFILDERARELIGEYPRRFTLLRTNTLIERVRKYNPEAAPAIQEWHKVFPIPQAIIDANIDTDFPQNPNYN